MKINFKCEKCGSDKIDEVMSAVDQYSIVTEIEPLEDNVVVLDYGGISYENGELEHYECFRCGERLMNKDGTSLVNSPEELYEWLKDNNMLEKE